MKIAIIGEIHEDGWKILKKENLECFETSNVKEETLKKELIEVDGIILRTASLNSEILKHCKNLKIVSRHGVGYDNVDLEYLNTNKIALGITSTSNAVSVAEHVLTSFLYLTKNIHLSDKLIREGRFTEKSSLPNFFELYRKNVLIFGFGRIGKEVAKRCKGFDANVYVVDPFVDKKDIEKYGFKVIDKIQGLKLADYISIHLPLNNKTKNLINENEFLIMKDTVIVVNTARGGIVNEHFLEKALKEHKIRGAALDVFETEPPNKSHPIFKLPNVLLSPHNAALSLECRKRMAIEAAENTVYFLKKNDKLNIANIVNQFEIKI